MFVFMMKKHNLDIFLGVNQQKIFNFMEKIEQGYLNNPYHNGMHGSDVL